VKKKVIISLTNPFKKRLSYVEDRWVDYVGLYIVIILGTILALTLKVFGVAME